MLLDLQKQCNFYYNVSVFFKHLVGTRFEELSNCKPFKCGCSCLFHWEHILALTANYSQANTQHGIGQIIAWFS